MQLRFGILTVSDSVAAHAAEDRGGPAVRAALAHGEWQVAEAATVPDDRMQIEATLKRWADECRLDIIFTTGGTGLGPRDVTPEATLAVADRVVPGIAEIIRTRSLEQTQGAMLSRGASCMRGQTLIINLPGSPKGATQGVETVSPVLEHAVATIHGARH